MEEQKWGKWDIFLLSCQIISVIVSIIIEFISNELLSEPKKLAIICACLGIPIIIVQVKITLGLNKVADNISKMRSKLNDAISQTSQIATLFQICSSQNERIRRFADRRISEMTKSLNKAAQIGLSGKLNVIDYYNELNYLADKLDQDEKGSIWAMTGFAPDEWSAAGGYENAWTQRLQKIAQRGVKTRRICFLSQDIINKFMNFTDDPSQRERHSPIEGLISLLKQYYSKPDKNCSHYIMLRDEFKLLEKTKGFFGIILSNQEKYIIQGEALNLDNGLTGEVLFNTKEIEDIYKEFEMACQQKNRELICYLRQHACPAFLDHLKQEGVII